MTQKLFLAPRSNEHSRENFSATLENGYPLSEIQDLLATEDLKALGGRSKLYIWGNAEAKKNSWEKMNNGDLVAFYARGVFVYVGRCILKKHSKEIALKLWGNRPNTEGTWEYVFFLDALRSVSIPMEEIRKLADYKENMVVLGFMPLNKKGLKRIHDAYGSLEAFCDTFSTGLSSKDILTLNKISETDNPSPKDVENFDEIMRKMGERLGLSTWEVHQQDQTPAKKERRTMRIERCAAIVQAMKRFYDNRCQICGFTFKQTNGGHYSEVAHIEPISSQKKGVDRPTNMMVLCPNHHKMLDYGYLKIISRTEYSMNGEEHKLLKPIFSDENIKKLVQQVLNTEK